MNWQPVVTALLGSWPSQVASWGREALAAYCAELEARSVDPEAALVAIRSCPASQKFPPSAPELAGLARVDPSRPTFEQALEQIRLVLRARTSVRKGSWEAGERERLDEVAQLERAAASHPVVAAFIDNGQKLARVRQMGLFDAENEWRVPRLRELREMWDRHVEALEGREVWEVASRSARGSLGRPDFAGAIGATIEGEQ